MSQWYCGVEGQQYGPYTWEQMRAMAEEGRLVSESYVRREVDQQWMTAKQVPGLLKKKNKPSNSTSTQLSVAAVKKAAKTTTNAVAPTSTAVVANSQAAEGSRIAKVRPAAPTASSSSVAIPVGAAVPPVGTAVPPVGVAVAEPPASSPLGFVVQTTVAVKSVKSAKYKLPADDGDVAPKKSNALLMTVILAGVVLLVGVVGVGVLIWSSLGRGKKEVAKEETAPAVEVAANPSSAVETNPVEVNPVEVNPVAGEVNPVTPTAPAVDSVPAPAAATSETAMAKAAPPAAPPSTMPAAEAAAAVKVLKAQSAWNDVTRVPGITILEVGLKVNSVWLAADEAGTRVEPTEGNASGARFVFVELQLTNKAKAARPYKSWNATAGSSVVLADAAGQPLGFVPTAATPSATRLGTVEIPAGKVLSDTLVFYAPAGSVEKLKLALAKSALAGTAKTRGSHFAFEIPREVLLRGAPPVRAASDPAAEPAAPPADAPPPLDVTPPAPPTPAVVPPVAVPAAPMPAAPPPAKFDPSAFDKELQKENEPAKGDAPKANMPKAEAPADDAQPVAPAAKPKAGKAGKTSKLPRK